LLKQERQAWLIVAVLFAALAFILGGTIATPGIFFAPLIGEFGWSHARVSLLASSVMLGTIPGSLAAGCLGHMFSGVLRIKPRWLLAQSAFPPRQRLQKRAGDRLLKKSDFCSSESLRGRSV
jgi:hypothetical protein